MSVTANPMLYWQDDQTVGHHVGHDVNDTEACLYIEDLWPEDSPKAGQLVTTWLLRSSWGSPHYITKDSGGSQAVTSLQVDTEALAHLVCAGLRGSGGLLEESPCSRPVVTVVDGWSAGPIECCSSHLGVLTRVMGKGMEWIPVVVSTRLLRHIVQTEQHI